jgi:hypothetical protein
MALVFKLEATVCNQDTAQADCQAVYIKYSSISKSISFSTWSVRLAQLGTASLVKVLTIYLFLKIYPGIQSIGKRYSRSQKSKSEIRNQYSQQRKAKQKWKSIDNSENTLVLHLYCNFNPCV